MKISIGGDHGGFELKEHLTQYLLNKGYELFDRGTHNMESVDYPDYAKKVVDDVLNNNADFGVIVCGTGIGISIAANRYKGIRAALITNVDYAKLARQHNNANIIALGGRFTSLSDAEHYVDTFLNTPFEGGRHKKRVVKIDSLAQ